jgi:hypothetical protein
MKVYDRTDALPRLYTVMAAEVLGDEAALDRLVDPSFDPRDRVLLAPADGVRTVVSGASAPGLATLESDEPERVRTRVVGAGPSYLVLSDTWYPGWRATLDGQEVPILRANLLFRAVAVPPGEHVVEFRYEPLSFRLGAALSTVSLVGGALLWLVVSRGRRRAVGAMMDDGTT